ncbi:hypothetical protein Y032_0663g1306 [Ancylostoma ceylanicum]|uniref:Uncharacterized protein n=1 Tax=Ancylostoma ceylanicum TaxID=53326 RepID=A0A016WJV0_9BILA|nr:hypothetical protein Y032_0663g1306 [Ancylostoma ceylanicum]
MAQWLEWLIAIRPYRWFHSDGDPKLSAVAAQQLLRCSVRDSLHDVPRDLLRMVILCLLLLALVIPSEAIPKLEKYIRKYKPITSVEGTRT